MDQVREEDDLEAIEHRKRILQLAEMMQYDDDHEESRVTQKELEVPKPQPRSKPAKKAEVESSDEDDLTDAAAFIEK